MCSKKADIEADICSVIDRGESPSLMEPIRLAEGSRYQGELTDLALELAQASSGFRRSLPDPIAASLANLVRSMNCYYSNLIEGHDTHPIDIERALKDDFSHDQKKRNLQLEARAHLAVQEWIDHGGLSGRALTVNGLREIHQRFYDQLPPELLVVSHPDTGEEVPVVPGKFRTRDVRVGRHVPISPGAVPRFVERFEEAFHGMRKLDMIVSAAAAHHRLAWIHPFLDGNGRVIRLVSHATLLETLETGALWSVARGLARAETEYKALLANCDQPRRNDLDGRGQLSEETLAAFSRFFLERCLDQVRFMERLVEPNRLRARILAWAAGEAQAGRLPEQAGTILETLLYRGELPRGDVPQLLGVSDRQCRRVLAAMMEHDVITSENTRAPLRLSFPATLASHWMPSLFPEKGA